MVQVLVLATVRDLFTGREARAKQSYVNMASGVAPIIAPTLGVLIATAAGWRGIYALLSAGAVVLLALAWLTLQESAPRTGAALTLRGTLRNFARVIRNPISFGNALVTALVFGSLFAFVSGSSLVLIGVLGASQRVYGLLFALTSAGLVTGSFLSARLSKRGVSHARLLGTGLTIMTTVCVILLLLSFAGWLSVPVFIPLVVIGNIGTGALRPNAAQGALEPMPDIVGVASALLSGMQMVIGALASAIAASLFDGRTALAMTGTMTFCSLAASLVYSLVVRPAERLIRTQNAHGTSASVAA
jgi:DHA1 family bicyclomycin/chloramphenicol resistance-like MFS transporter